MKRPIRLAVIGLIALAAGMIAGRPARSASQQSEAAPFQPPPSGTAARAQAAASAEKNADLDHAHSKRLFLEALPIDGAIPALLVSSPANFDFSRFESLPEADIIPAAKRYLEQKHPPGSNSKAAMHELEAAGAKCWLGAVNKRELLWCEKYTRTPLSYGPIALFSSMRWQISFDLAPGTHKIKNVSVSRNLDTI